MSLIVTHTFVSVLADAGSALLIQPQRDWNAAHTLAGVASVVQGGTGHGSYTTGDLLYASAGTTLSALAIVAQGSVLLSGTTPAWSAPYTWNAGASPANNVLFGLEAGFSATTGFSITAIGSYAAAAVQSGASITCVGTRAGEANISGSYVTYMGSFSGQVELGAANAYYGYKSGWASTNGNRCTYLGDSSAFTFTSGDDNTVVGQHSGKVGVTGSSNTALGASSEFSSTTPTGQTVIGFAAAALGDDSITLGRSTDKVHVAGGFLDFTGTSASFPAFKRNAATVQVRLADDSAFTGIEALQFIAGYFTGNVTDGLQLQIGSATKWRINNVSPFEFYPQTDNAFDLGATAQRARTGYFGTSVVNAGYYEGVEMSAPAAPGANGFRVYAEDNGSGKTRLMCVFNSGAAQQLAIQP